MNIKQKLALVEEFNSLANAFDDTLGLEREVVLFRPFHDSWSIVEQVVHCADFDIANFHRYRWGIVSPGTTVLSFDGTWTAVLDYQNSDLSLAIDGIKAVRSLMASHLKRIIDVEWAKFGYMLSDGSSFNLEESLQHYINHVGFHRQLIDRNLKLFSQKGI